MKYKELRHFLISQMKLSHIYQPLLVRTLVEAGGYATIRQIAASFLSQDESQLKYYEKRIKEMPVKVLSKHGVVELKGNLIQLKVQDKLSFDQIAELKQICDEKIHEYVTKRGISIWDYRFFDESIAPDPLRLRLLKEAKGRCALCGCTKDDRPLDIDHIIPRSRGGKTEYANLQVLCSKCNRTKGNKEAADYRRMIGSDSKDGCVFCHESMRKQRIIEENDLAFIILDKYPVVQDHSLIIPKRHVEDYFDLSAHELTAVQDLVLMRRKQIINSDKSVTGFNIGVNSGESAGQTIMHVHIHLIPRRHGDTPNPRGGVRGVIPGKMSY